MSPYWPRAFPQEIPIAVMKRLAEEPPTTDVREHDIIYRRDDNGCIYATRHHHVAEYTSTGKRVR